MIIIAKYTSTIEYQLKTTLDSSGVTKLQNELNQVSVKMRQLADEDLISATSYQDAVNKLNQFKKILSSSFNTKLGMLDTSALVSGLNKAGLSLKSLQSSYSLIGSTGTAAFNNVLTSIGKIDTSLKTTSKTADKIFNTIGNTVRWGVIASGFQEIMNSIHSAAQYVQDLDSSLTNIMMVTDYSRDAMNEYAKSANEAAKALGSTTVAMTDATLVFAQQGFNLDDSTQLATLSTKLANASQQDTATTSDQITAYMNAYGLSDNMEELSKALDAWAEVANVSAADVEELATASQKAAATANTVGVNMDQLASQIATIESVTKDAPENIGNGLKTIYARFSDISMGETLDDGVTLGQVTGTLDKIGVTVLDSAGKMRDVGDIMEDLMGVWSDLDSTQKNSIATTLAGKYQLSRFEALMNSSDMYNEYKQSAQEGKDKGTLDQMNEKYVDSLEGKLNKLQASFEGIFSNLFDTDDFYGFLDGLSSAVDLVNELIESLGGITPILTGIGATALKVFSGNIADSVSRVYSNFASNKKAKELQNSSNESIQALGLSTVKDGYNDGTIDFIQQGSALAPHLNNEEIQEYNKLLEKQATAASQAAAANDDLEQSILSTNLAAGKNVIQKQEDGTYGAAGLYGLDYEKKKNIKTGENVEAKLANISGASSEFQEAATTFSTKFGAALKEDVGQAKALAEQLSEAANKNIEALSKEEVQEAEKYSEYLKLICGYANEIQEGDSIDESTVTTLLNELDSDEGKSMMKNFANVSQKKTMTESSEVVGKQNSKDNAETNNEYMQGQGKSWLQDQQFQSAIQNINNLIGAIGQLAMAYQSFQALGSLWSNEDLTIGDKILQTVLNLSAAIPMLTSGISQIVPVISKIVKGIQGLTAVEVVGTAATEAATVATVSFGAALAATIGIAALVVAAVAAIAIGVKAIIDDYNKAEIAAEQAKEQSDEYNKSIQQTSSEYSTFSDNIKAYEEARAALGSLTQGTDEYNNKLKEVNSNLLSALQIYPELAKYVSRDSNGALYVNNSDLADFQQDYQNLQDKQNAVSTMLDANSDEKALESAETNTRRQVQYTLDGSLLTQELSEFHYNAIKNLMETKGEQSIYNENDVREALADAYGVSANAISDKLVAAIVSNADKLVKQLQETQTQEKSIQLQKEEGLKSYLGSDYEASTASNNALSLMTRSGGQYDSAYDTALESYKNWSTSDLARDYAKLIGGTADGEKVKDAEGNDLDVTADTMKSALASAQAMQQAAADWQDVVGDFEAIGDSRFSDDVGFDTGSTLADWKPNGEMDVSNLSKTKQRELYEWLSQGNDLTPEDLGIDDAWAQKAGFDNAQSFAESFSNGLKEALGKQNTLDELLNRTELSSEEVESVKNLVDELDELETAYNKGYLSEDDYNDKLIELSSNYKNVSEQVDELKTSQKALQTAQDKYSKAVSKYGENSELAKNALEELQKAQKDLAKSQSKLKGAMLLDEWADAKDEVNEYLDVLESAEKGSKEYTDVVKKLADDFSSMLGVDISSWSEDQKEAFFDNEQNANDLKDALNGDYEAYMRVKIAASEAIFAKLGLDDTQFRTVLTGIQEYAASGEFATLEAGAVLDNSEFLNALTQMLQTMNLTADQINGVLGSLEAMGIHAEIEYEDIPAVYSDGSEDANPGMVIQEAKRIVKNVTYTKTGASKDEYTNTFNPYNGGNSNDDGSGSGSGGSGSGSSYTPKTQDLIDDEIDRYEVIDTKLDAVSNDLDRIADAQDRLTGSKLISNMTEQISLLEKQRDLEKEKLSIQQQEALELQDKLSGYGISFDSEGFMSNYATVHQGLIDKVNDLKNQYNATSDEEGQNALNEQIESANEALEKFNDTYERYDELIGSDLKDTLATLQDIEDQIEDIRISAFKTSVDAADEIKDLQESLADFNATFQDIYDEDPFVKAGTSVKKLSYYFDNATKSATEYYDSLIAQMEESAAKDGVSESYKEWAKKQIEAMEEAKAQYGEGTVEGYGTGYLDMALKNMDTILSEINQFNEEGSSSIFGEDSADMYEVAKDIYDQATEYVEDYKSEVQDLRDDILDMIDDINERFENRMDEYQAIVDELEHQANINELLHGDQSYANMNQILAAQQNVYKNQIAQYQDQLELLKDMQSTMEEGTEEWQTLEDQILDTTSDMNDMIETSLENLEKQYSNTVNNITDEWIKGVTGGEDLDWIETEWELINQNADYYLDDVNKAYNIQKLQSKYLDLLDDANDLHTQQKITEQMEQQLDYLREKTNLSEYDVEYAEAQLEILQKQIALEDAQNNKNQMKLRRDSQGNYSYVYTADQDDVSSAESDLLDAQNNAYNLSKNQMKQTQDDSISALKSAQSTINDIWTNANLTLEEKQKRTQTILDSLKTYIASVSEQLSTSEKNIIEDFLGMCENLTDENRTQLDDTYEQIKNGNNDAFSEIDERWVSSMENWESLMDDFSASVDEMGKDLESNGESYQESVDELAGLVEADFNDITSSIKDCDDATASLASSQTAFIEQLKNDAGTVKAYESSLQEYTSKIADAENTMAAYKNQVNDLQSQLVSYQQENANLQLKIDMLENPSKYGGSSGSGGYSSSNSSDVENLSKRIANSIWVYGDWGNGQTRIDRITERFGYDMYEAVQAWFNDNPAYGYDWVDYDAGYERYASGGYTGSWSDNTGEEKNGKLAILHQKELVLNSTDTENILAAVETVREFATSLKTGLFAQTVSEILGTAQAQQTIGQDVEQSVHITAEFPNANSAADIEEALLSLNDRAIQYAYKTK